jgi:hypothetical protein
MPTDKSWRSVGGQATPPTRGAEYQVKRYPAPEMAETRKAPPGQARSPAPQHLGATRGVGAGGAKVSEKINTSSHSRAWGLEST